MDNEILEILKVMQQDIKLIQYDMKDLKIGQDEIKNIIQKLEPKNANIHVEMSNKISEVAEKFDLLRLDLNKVEVVTSQNSYEIQYLKAVK